MFGSILTWPVEVDREDFTLRVKELMYERGLSHTECAELLQIEAAYLSQIFSGVVHIPLNFVISFCALVGCSVADLLPFVNSTLPFPFESAVRGGGYVEIIAPDPYRLGIDTDDQG